MKRLARTRLAVLGTLSELHREPIAYDLRCLSALVVDLAPDLLCAEITREDWEGNDLSSAALEVREALQPVVAATDIVLVPVAPTPRRFADFGPATGWRGSVIRALDRLLRWVERRANRPEAIQGVVFHTICHAVCMLTQLAWSAQDRTAWQAQNRILADNILAAVRQDPGSRVLVAVQCQRIHDLSSFLGANAHELQIMDYREL